MNYGNPWTEISCPFIYHSGKQQYLQKVKTTKFQHLAIGPCRKLEGQLHLHALLIRQTRQSELPASHSGRFITGRRTTLLVE
jgi:hypothetical protein